MKIISTIFGGLGLAGLTIMGLMWMSGYNPFNPPVKTQRVVQSSNQTLRNWDSFLLLRFDKFEKKINDELTNDTKVVASIFRCRDKYGEDVDFLNQQSIILLEVQLFKNTDFSQSDIKFYFEKLNALAQQNCLPCASNIVAAFLKLLEEKGI